MIYPETKELLIAKFPDVFEGTGQVEGPYHLEIEPDTVTVVHPPRKFRWLLSLSSKKN